MIFGKSVTIFITLTLVLTSGFFGYSVSSTPQNTLFKITSNLKESHIINVPYVGQTGPYCAYASFTSILKYNGINVNESDLLYVTGAGHSLAFPGHRPIEPILKFKKNIVNRAPESGYMISMETDFICSLYGLSFNKWSIGRQSKLSPIEKWDLYWPRVKENISNDIPVVTSAHNCYLKSVIDMLDELVGDSKIINLLKIISSSHAIVIVGYNESNQTVCFHDPEVDIFGYPEYGNYVWMSQKNFSKAVEFGIVYPIWTFRKVSEPKNDEDIFIEAHQRNIQRMKGNESAYGKGMMFSGSQFNGILGIKALEELKRYFQPGLRYRYLTMKQYRQNGLRGRLMKIFCKLAFPNDPLVDFYSEFGILYLTDSGSFHFTSLDKQRASQVLWNYSYLSPTITREAELFDMEVENWTKLYNEYSKFINREIILTNHQASSIIENMDKILDNIIAIEQQIIDNAT